MSMKAYSATSLDDALSAACRDLQARIGEIRYEIVAEDDGVVTIEADLDPVAVLGLFMAEMFRAGALALSVSLREEDGLLAGDLTGADSTLLTGNGGQGLDALQYLANRVLDHRLGEHPPVRLDVGGFKSRRELQLAEQAREAAAKVSRDGRAVTLSAMAPAARRIVHLALADDPDVETESQGNGFLKRVVVRPRRRR